MSTPARSGFWRRLVSSNRELAAAELAKEAVASGAMTIGSCEDRDIVDLVGTLSTVTLNPPDGSQWLEADFSDGTGQVRLVWMGRRRIRGIDAGRRLRVQGRLSYVDGRRTIYNPRYELRA